MRFRLVSLLALAAAAIPSASFGLECPAQERKEQHGIAKEWFCVPIKGQQCGPGRKFSIRSRQPLWGSCEADPNAPQGKCAAGETAESKRGRDYCKPGAGSGGKCGKGRKNAPAHWDPSLVVCEDDKSPQKPERDASSCPTGERSYQASKTAKAYCEPVGGRCGMARVAVNELPGHQRCVDK